MTDERWMSLGEMFDFPADDPIDLYPFEARCLAVDWNPDRHPELLELGRASLDFVFGRSTRVSRQIRGGEVTLYFPERWLSVHEKIGLMQALVDLHQDYPLKRVNVITSEPVIIADFYHGMVRLLRDDRTYLPDTMLNYKDLRVASMDTNKRKEE